MTQLSPPPRDTQREDPGAPRAGAGPEPSAQRRERRGPPPRVTCSHVAPARRARPSPGSCRGRTPAVPGEGEAIWGAGPAGTPPECSAWGSGGRGAEGLLRAERGLLQARAQRRAGGRRHAPAHTVSTGKFTLSPGNCLANRRWNPTRPQFGDNVYCFLI